MRDGTLRLAWSQLADSRLGRDVCRVVGKHVCRLHPEGFPVLILAAPGDDLGKNLR